MYAPMFKGIRPNPASAQKIFFPFVRKGLLSKHVVVTAMQFFKSSAYYCTERNGTERNGKEKA
jgi:hypothetical protein